MKGTGTKRYAKWYNNLTPIGRLTVSFILNWIYWLIAWLIGEKLFFDEVRSWAYHFMHATWMAFFMTILFNWQVVKSIFICSKSNTGSPYNNTGKTTS